MRREAKACRPGLRARVARLLDNWFRLTADEQCALAVVLGLFLLGLAVRAWRALHAAAP